MLDKTKLTILFQPVIDLQNRSIFGYEAFVRGPTNSPYVNPENLIRRIQQDGEYHQLQFEQFCHQQIFQAFQERGLVGQLFINGSLLQKIDGYTTEKLQDLANKYQIKMEWLVLELSNQGGLSGGAEQSKNIEKFHNIGCRIAIDESSLLQYGNLSKYRDVDYVKLDRHLIADVAFDATRQEQLLGAIDAIHKNGCKVIAEGVETVEDYRFLSSAYVFAAQGFYFGRPLTNPSRHIKLERFCLSDVDCNREIRVSPLTESIVSLLHKVNPVAPDLSLDEVEQIFRNNPHLHAIPVVNASRRALGFVRRDHLYSMFSLQYGRSLYAKDAAVTAIDENTLSVSLDMSVTEVSDKLTAGMQERVQNEFIITYEGIYQGVGKVIDLLHLITKLQVRNARYANPLTMLPGNVPIYEEFESCIAAGNHFAIAYFDLDNFKPFNDIYGYSRGDTVISYVAELLQQHCSGVTDFIGHVGGDDFIVIFRNNTWHTACETILQDFQAATSEFYSENDYLNGGISAKNRDGIEVFFPLLSLSIGVVSIMPHHEMTQDELAILSTKAKKGAKGITGNALFTICYPEQVRGSNFSTQKYLHFVNQQFCRT